MGFNFFFLILNIFLIMVIVLLNKIIQTYMNIDLSMYMILQHDSIIC